MSTEFLVEPNTFYRVKNVDTDVFVRGDYGDSYDGSASSGDITTAAPKSLYLGKSVAPVIPEFAGKDIELSSLSLKFYPNTALSSNGVRTPRFKFYKAADNFPLTEGSYNIIKEGEDFTAFCSFQNWGEPSLVENFSGINVGFSDREYYAKEVVDLTNAWADTEYHITTPQLHTALGKKGYFSWKKGGDLRQGPNGFTGWFYKRPPDSSENAKLKPVGRGVENNAAGGYTAGSAGEGDEDWFKQSKYHFTEAELVAAGATAGFSRPAGSRGESSYEIYNYTFIIYWWFIKITIF